MSETGKVYQIQYPTTVSGKVYNVRDVSGEQNITGKVYQVASVNGGGGTTIKNQDKQITENGTYTADVGYTGLGTVTVNVPSGGGSATKFGASVDSFLGDVDENEMYKRPNVSTVIDLSGAKKLYASSFMNEFAGIKDLVFKANDVTHVYASVFENAFNLIHPVNLSEKHYLSISFDSLEEITGEGAFRSACTTWNNTGGNKEIVNISFKKLKKISGNNVFTYFGRALVADYDAMFPVLEEITGNNVFNNAFYPSTLKRTITSVKKITGGTATYNSTFGSISYANTVWNFPSATEFTGYIWNASASYPGEIHFAAANQAAIEACDGYANKWGFAGATIYFDL